jgi:hypothetical protein
MNAIDTEDGAETGSKAAKWLECRHPLRLHYFVYPPAPCRLDTDDTGAAATATEGNIHRRTRFVEVGLQMTSASA